MSTFEWLKSQNGFFFHVCAFKLKKDNVIVQFVMLSTVNNKSTNGTKAKHWCLTLCISDDLDAVNTIDAYKRAFKDFEKFTTYQLYGEEIAAGGLHHLQCYIVGIKQITLPTLRRHFGEFGNTYTVARGTPQQNYAYCTKDGKYTEFGDLPQAKYEKGGENTRQKWENLRDLAVKREMTLIMEQHPKEFILHYRMLKQIGFDMSKKPDNLEDPCGEWLYGEPGVGKSYTARRENPDHYVKMMNKWWDNYDGEAAVIVEDFDPNYGQSMGYFLKIWADRYAFPAEIKCHKIDIRPKKIIVTSQYTIEACFNDANTIAALKRRFKVRNIVKMQDNDTKTKGGNSEISKKSNKVKKHDEPFLAPRKKYKRDAKGNFILTTPKDEYPKIGELFPKADYLEECMRQDKVIDLTSVDSDDLTTTESPNTQSTTETEITSDDCEKHYDSLSQSSDLACDYSLSDDSQCYTQNV